MMVCKHNVELLADDGKKYLNDVTVYPYHVQHSERSSAEDLDMRQECTDEALSRCVFLARYTLERSYQAGNLVKCQTR